ncbi:uncharacterized protein LOC62_06G008101 [Vanrija pseudolonga]|uniref:Uncharacterized protein n=1 Tax=Vanrija pseudolonga TaxID=143232 RepID=A0AAF1BL19_9TREE|nr:hypothetical protein LOC62_06G008101 [Vanrija pseudolonga]
MLTTLLLLPLVAAAPGVFQRQAAAASSSDAVAASSSAVAAPSDSAAAVSVITPSAVATTSAAAAPSSTSVIGTVQFTAPLFNQFCGYSAAWGQIGQPNIVSWTPINQALDLYLANDAPGLIPSGKTYLLASNLPPNTNSFNPGDKLIASGAKPGSNYYVFLTPVGNPINNIATSGGFNVLAAATPLSSTAKPGNSSAGASDSASGASASATATSKPSSAGKVAGVSVAAAIIAAVGAAAF